MAFKRSKMPSIPIVGDFDAFLVGLGGAQAPLRDAGAPLTPKVTRKAPPRVKVRPVGRAAA